MATTRSLRLRVGDRVRVRSLDEILPTLDADGRLDALPFMPEMIEHCGREFTVLKRIDKVKDNVDRTGVRRMHDAVILDGVRCDGTAHGGCQARCQMIFKEAWLSRVGARRQAKAAAPSVPAAPPACSEARLVQVTRRASAGDGERFSCQATEIKQASSYLVWWDVRQYVRDLWSGNVGLFKMGRVFAFWIFRLWLRWAPGYRSGSCSMNASRSCAVASRIRIATGAWTRRRASS